MPTKALILLTVAIALAATATAQFKFDHSSGVSTVILGNSVKLDIGVIPITGTINGIDYSISVGSLPNGLTLSKVNNQAEFAGMPTAIGTSNFTLTAVANMSTGIFSGSLPLSIVVNSPVGVTVTPGTLTFNPNPSSTVLFPSLRTIDVNSTGGGQTVATVTMDDGNGGQAPIGFSLSPNKVNTPARVIVSYAPSANSTPGSKTARVIVTPAGGAQPMMVNLTATSPNVTPGLSVFPPTFHFKHNFKEGVNAFYIFRGSRSDDHPPVVSGGAPGISVNLGSVKPTANTPVPFEVTFDPAQALNVNDLMAVLVLSSPVGDARVTVDVTRAPLGPAVRVHSKQTHFSNQLGSSQPRFGGYSIYNTGAPGSTLIFGTSILGGTPGSIVFGAGSSIQDGTGRVTTQAPYQLNFTYKPSTKIGLDSAMMRVSAQGDPSVSTEIAVSQETTANTLVETDASPPSLVFVITGNTPVTKTFTPSTTGPATSFIAAPNTNDGGNWLILSQSNGTLSSSFSPNVTATVNPTLIPQTRLNFGRIDVNYGDGSHTSQYVIAINSGSFSQSAGHARGEAAATCTPTQVVVAPGVRSGFSNSMGFADGLSAEIYDDCGNALTGPENTVVAVFDNGDPPVVLENLGVAAGESAYLGMWTPLTAAQTTITFVGVSGGLRVGTAGVSGTVSANQFNTPVLFDGGTVNNTNPFGGPVLAPGMVTSIYGLNLAPSAVSPGAIPLTNAFSGTSVTIGGKPAPFYFLSSGQLNVQAPTDLVAGQPASVAVQTSTGFAVLSTPATVFSAAPGVSSFADGHIIAQHADFTLVDAAHPAKPGEAIVIYLSGMGATTPSVATGQQASGAALTPAQIQPTVTVGSQPAAIAYAGLTPGGIGLYQINCTVPATLSAGDAEVVVTQNGYVANRTLLQVGSL